MKYFVNTDETGRVMATTDQEQFAEGMSKFDFPDNFDFSKQSDYRIQNGELIHDPEPEPIDYQIANLKQELFDTDYVVIKTYEAIVTGIPLPKEDEARYKEILSNRQKWRQEINDLKKEMIQNG